MQEVEKEIKLFKMSFFSVWGGIGGLLLDLFGVLWRRGFGGRRPTDQPLRSGGEEALCEAGWADKSEKIFIFAVFVVSLRPMKIRSACKVREMAGEHIVVMPGTYGVDMTRVISLNASSLVLWEALAGSDFELADVVRVLTDHYEVDQATAERDAAAWIEQLKQCGVVE